jgi:hypothetical protein
MSDDVAAQLARLRPLLTGPSTTLVAAILAVPARTRLELLHGLIAVVPPAVAAGQSDEQRWSGQRWHQNRRWLEALQQPLQAHLRSDARALAACVRELLASASGWGMRSAWLALWTLARAGIIEAPQHADYAMGPWALGGGSDLREELRGDLAALQEPLWNLFTLEGDRERSFANLDKYAKHPRGRWLDTLVELAAGGELERGRLLREALASLQRDFPAYRATWFARLYEALQPTAAERVAHLGDCLRLVGSRIPQVAAFGVRAVEAAAKAGARLPFDRLDELEPAWSARQKGVVMAALRVAGAMTPNGAGPRRQLAQAMARALGNAAGDVQLAAVRQLEKLGLSADEFAATVAPYRDNLLPRVRGASRAFGEEPANAGEDSRGRAAAAPPLAVGGQGAPVPVVPIGSFDELVRELTALVAGADDPLVLERVLDGVVRHAGSRPADFARRTAGLKKLTRRELPHAAQSFVAAWLEDRPLGEREGLQADAGMDDLPALFQPRWCEVLHLARTRPGLPLLALPTHAPFTVAAQALAERLAVWQRAGAAPGEVDVEQALRRVPTQQREEIRQQLPAPLRAIAERAFASAVVGIEPVMEWRKLRDGSPYRRQRVQIGDLPVAPAQPMLSLVAAAKEYPHRCSWGAEWYPTEFDAPILLRSLAGLAPTDLELLYAAAAARIGANVDGGTVARGDIAFLEPLLWPASRFGPNANLLLAIALGARAPEMHGIAVDVVLRALADGRLPIDGLAAALSRLFAIRFVVCSRWAKSLRTVADANRAAAGAVLTLLEAMLVGPCEDVARELGGLLELANDLVVATGRRFTAPATLEFLSAVAARGGKAGRLARALI